MSWIAAIAAVFKTVATLLGILRDKEPREQGAKDASLAERNATLSSVGKAQEIEARKQPTTIEDSLKRL